MISGVSHAYIQTLRYFLRELEEKLVDVIERLW
jgi:hypothetical protein